MRLILPACIFIFSFFRCHAQFEDLRWLAGKWKLHNKDVFEIWTAAHDNTSLKAISFKVAGTDTIVSEEIRMLSQNDSLYYVPDVAGVQAPVYFAIVHYDDTGFIAENKSHDFPKVIRYKIRQEKTKTFLEAAIEGDEKKIVYQFEKIP